MGKGNARDAGRGQAGFPGCRTASRSWHSRTEWGGPSPEALPSVPLCFLICTIRILHRTVWGPERELHMHRKPCSHRHGTGELPDPGPAYTGGPMGSSRVRCHGTVLGLRVRGREVPRHQENLAHLGGRAQGETIAIDGQR